MPTLWIGVARGQRAATMYNRVMTPRARTLAARLTADLRAVTVDRLRAVVVYGPHAHEHATDDAPVHVLAIVRGLGFSDLEMLARAQREWRRAGLATPFIVDQAEFARSFDAFPIEFGAILAHHEVLEGDDPFAGRTVDSADLRRACEVQARSHLLHLREGYLETGGDPAAIHGLVASSAAPLLSLLTHLARLAGDDARTPEALAALAARWTGAPAPVYADVLALAARRSDAVDAARLFPSYLAAVEGLTAFVDRLGGPGVSPGDRRVRRRPAVLRTMALTLVLQGGAAMARAQEYPALTQPVNDLAGVVDPSSAARIDGMIRALQAKTGDVVVVATVKTIAPESDIRAYAVKLFENGERGIGAKGHDNGLLVLLAVAERRVWIEVGYGLEEFITDGFSGETSRQVMVPHFREGDYGGGLAAGVERLVGRIAEGRHVSLEGVPAPQPVASPAPSLPPGTIMILLVVGVLVLRAFAGMRRYHQPRGWGRRRTWSGWSSGVGPFGGGFGGGWGSGGGGGFGGGFGGFGGGRSGGGGGGASW